MKCSLESCRFNARGECCNAEAYQQCINACEAVLGEEYQRFKEWERENCGKKDNSVVVQAENR